MISPADNSAGRSSAEPDPALGAEVRALRDKVYGPCTDDNWLACREFWLTPDNIAWLKEQAAKCKP